MNFRMSMLDTLNPAAHALAAIDLAQRAGHGETPWSRTSREAPLDAGGERPPMERYVLRRAVLVISGIALSGVLAVAVWIA